MAAAHSGDTDPGSLCRSARPLRAFATISRANCSIVCSVRVSSQPRWVSSTSRIEWWNPRCGLGKSPANGSVRTMTALSAG